MVVAVFVATHMFVYEYSYNDTVALFYINGVAVFGTKVLPCTE